MTVVALVSCVELVAHVDGVNAEWATAGVLVSDVCVAATDGVTVVLVTASVLESDIYVIYLVDRASICIMMYVYVHVQ
jgi:hypothetical protein